MDTVAVLANSTAADVENVLVNARPFESKKRGKVNLYYNDTAE
jgi:hypothetical protein